MKKIFCIVSLLLITTFCGKYAVGQTPAVVVKSSLQRSTPEEQGVSSEGILKFLDAAAQSQNEFHSIMVLRHGKVVAEGWWNPYQSSLKHTLYSTSKSFTATAVGFAVSEGLLTVNDKVISFFPNDLPDTVSANLAALTVKDVLMMSDGQDPDPTFKVVSAETNWVKGFLSLPIVDKPGTKFLYNSLGTYMLSAIVQKVTGQSELEYLKPRLFTPLGIEGMDWETDPRGINTGGWGLRLKTEDMAKFGQLFLQKGQWMGKQVLPATWVADASSAQIIQHPGLPEEKKNASDWEQGYGYQMWRCRHNAFRGDGAFGQYIIVLPEEDAVIAITAETPDMQNEINLVWDYLLPAMQDGKLPADTKNAARLKQRLSALALPVPKAALVSTLEKSISGKTYAIEQNEKHIRSVAFRFKNNECKLTLATDTAAYTIGFDAGAWEKGTTTMHGPYLLTGAKATLKGLPPFITAGDYLWEDENTLRLVLRYIESPHTETLVCRFNGNAISVELQNSFDYGKKSISLKGTQVP